MEVSGCLASARRLTWLLLMGALSFTVGCVRSPDRPDENYPSQWPAQFSSLGPKCEGLNGSYLNKGVVRDRNGLEREVPLADLLLGYAPKSLSVAHGVEVLSFRVDPGFAFTTLYVKSGGDEIEVPHCVCYHQTLLVPAVKTSTWGFPYVGMGGSQTNAWLTKATDDTLIVQIEGNTSGMLVVVPYYYQGSTAWARFQPALAGTSSGGSAPPQ